MTGLEQPSLRRRPPRRRRRWWRGVALFFVVVLVFGLGIALGQALNDGPPAAATQIYVRTLTPVPQATVQTTGP